MDHSLVFARSKNNFAHSSDMAFQHAMNVYNAQHGQPQSTVPVSAHGRNPSVGICGVTDSQQHAQAQLQTHAQTQLQQSPYTQMVQTHRGLVHVPAQNIRASSAQRQAVKVAELGSRSPSLRRQSGDAPSPCRGGSQDRTVGTPHILPPGTRRKSPAVPMETMDWLHAFEGIRNRLDALERTSRNHAQAMSVLEVQQKRTNQAHSEFTRGFSQAFDLVNKCAEQMTHMGSLVDAAIGY